MSFLGRLFGRKAKAPAGNPAPPSGGKDTFQVFDQYGREMFISRADWEKNVLPGTIRNAWNDPEQLYTVLVGSLSDGFRTAQITSAAEHLYRIDPVPHRGELLWGILLKDQGLLDQAEKVLREALERHGQDGSTLTNLAKVYFQRNDRETTEAIMCQALEVDPNQENGLTFYRALRRERGGDEADREALQKIAANSTSWLPQLWLARTALDSGQTAEAQAFYREALAHADRPVPRDLLMQMSGDLGQRGYVATLLELTEPHFDAAEHGLGVGNNLIKANVELGRFDQARRVLDELYARKRPDWANSLSYWDQEIAKARAATSRPVGEPASMQMVRIDGPVWSRPESAALDVFPETSPRAPTVCFLGSSAETVDAGQAMRVQVSDGPGKLSRALPLFLAEQAYFGTRAAVQTWIPWLAEEGHQSFVLAGDRWSDETAVDYVNRFMPECDFIVVCHLRASVEPWKVDARLVRSSDGARLAQTEVTFPSEDPAEAFDQLSERLLKLLAAHAGVVIHPMPVRYWMPPAVHFISYLVRLEQLLAVRCAGMEPTNENFLNGERAIIAGNLELCVNCPDNVVTRLLLAQTLAAMSKVRLDVVQEFRERLALLERQNPMSDEVAQTVRHIYTEAGLRL